MSREEEFASTLECASSCKMSVGGKEHPTPQIYTNLLVRTRVSSCSISSARIIDLGHGALSGPMDLGFTAYGSQATTVKPSSQSPCPSIRCSHCGRLPHIVAERASTPRGSFKQSHIEYMVSPQTTHIEDAARSLFKALHYTVTTREKLASIVAFTLGQTGQSR